MDDYLDAVIKETLRIRPVVPGVVRKMKEPFELRGYEIPVGTRVAPNIYLTHRNPEVFPEPDCSGPSASSRAARHLFVDPVRRRHPPLHRRQLRVARDEGRDPDDPAQRRARDGLAAPERIRRRAITFAPRTTRSWSSSERHSHRRPRAGTRCLELRWRSRPDLRSRARAGRAMGRAADRVHGELLPPLRRHRHPALPRRGRGRDLRSGGDQAGLHRRPRGAARRRGQRVPRAGRRHAARCCCSTAREHMRQRKLLLPPFHGERMQRYGELIAEIAERDIDGWPVGEPFALRPRTQAITLEVIMRAVFGIDEARAPGGAARRRSPSFTDISTARVALGSAPLPALQHRFGTAQPVGAVRRRARGGRRAPLRRDRRRRADVPAWPSARTSCRCSFRLATRTASR